MRLRSQYSCDKCQLKFSQSMYFKKHTKLIHNNEQACGGCSKEIALLTMKEMIEESDKLSDNMLSKNGLLREQSKYF